MNDHKIIKGVLIIATVSLMVVLFFVGAILTFAPVSFSYKSTLDGVAEEVTITSQFCSGKDVNGTSFGYKITKNKVVYCRLYSLNGVTNDAEPVYLVN